MPARAATRDPAHQGLVLEPNRIEKQSWKDLWRYRELFVILAWRDITFPT
jgi:lipopolysaccharide transport system permease protein